MKRRVLIVDDDALSRQVLRHLLEFEGYEVEEAIDGFHCLAKLQDSMQGFDFITLDIYMHGLDGGETYRGIRAIYPNIPVIIISAAFTLRDIGVEPVSTGEVQFLRKPIDANEFQICCRNAVNLNWRKVK